MSEIGFIFFGWLLGLVSKPVSDAIDWCFRGPRLKLEFDGNDEEFRIRTPVRPELPNQQPGEAYYVRIRVVNSRGWRMWAIRRIRNCRGYLVDVRQRNPESGEFECVGYCDSIPLKWSYLSDDASHGGLEISEGVHQYLNVVATFSNRPDFVPEWVISPDRYKLLFDSEARMPHGDANQFALLLTVRVCADEVNPEERKIVVEWHGAWDNFEVYSAQVAKKAAWQKPGNCGCLS